MAAVTGEDWDARYRAAPAPFGDRPSGWLVETVEGLPRPPASALALADGDGRNSRWLAARGIATRAVDLSREATRQGMARDRATGLSVAREAGDLGGGWSPGQTADLVALIFLQGPPDLRRAALASACAALAPGGVLVVEGFAAPAGHDAPLGPPDDAARWQAQELRDWTAGLAVEAMAVVPLDLDEGPRHRGRARVLRARLGRPG